MFVASARPAEPAPISERSIVEQAAASWVFSPRIGVDGSSIVVRIVAVQPGSHVLLVRTEQIKPGELEVHVVLMMRDLVRAAGVKGGPPAPTPQPNESAVVEPARSPGRAVLAFNSAVFGGYIGFALQSAGGSNDPRLTYPLIALGTGIGLGGAVLAAEEWDIGVGDAWYLSAGTWWPAIGAALTGERPASKRYLYSAAAAGGGLALSTTAVAFEASPKETPSLRTPAARSGWGSAASPIAIQGRTDVTPTLGLGTGAIVGVVAAGASRDSRRHKLRPECCSSISAPGSGRLASPRLRARSCSAPTSPPRALGCGCPRSSSASPAPPWEFS
jgi:hypothetical protein